MPEFHKLILGIGENEGRVECETEVVELPACGRDEFHPDRVFAAPINGGSHQNRERDRLVDRCGEIADTAGRVVSRQKKTIYTRRRHETEFKARLGSAV